RLRLRARAQPRLCSRRAIAGRGSRAVPRAGAAHQARGAPPMSYLVERLAELKKHLAHLRVLRPRVTSAQSLRDDLSLHNDVLFSLLMVAQLVIDVASDVDRLLRAVADYIAKAES